MCWPGECTLRHLSASTHACDNQAAMPTAVMHSKHSSLHHCQPLLACCCMLQAMAVSVSASPRRRLLATRRCCARSSKRRQTPPCLPLPASCGLTRRTNPANSTKQVRTQQQLGRMQQSVQASNACAPASTAIEVQHLAEDVTECRPQPPLQVAAAHCCSRCLLLPLHCLLLLLLCRRGPAWCCVQALRRPHDVSA